MTCRTRAGAWILWTIQVTCLAVAAALVLGAVLLCAWSLLGAAL